MKNITVARRYARALFDLASQHKQLDEVVQGMANIRHAIKGAPELATLLRNPMVAAADKHKLLASVTSNKMILKFIDVLERRKRLGLLETIQDQLAEMADAAKGVRRAVVKSAQPLSDDQKRAVEAGLAKSTGGSVIGRFEVDASLLGGVWAQIGDKVLDASVRGRLDSLRHALANSTN